MDLDSVELAEIKTILSQINARLEKLEPVPPGPPGPPPVLPKLDFCHDVYKDLGHLMRDMGLKDYYSIVSKHLIRLSKYDSDDLYLFDSLNALKYLTGDSLRAIKFYTTCTPQIILTDEKIRVNMIFPPSQDLSIFPRAANHMCAMMKFLIKCCYEEKYWDQVESNISIVIYSRDCNGSFRETDLEIVDPF